MQLYEKGMFGHDDALCSYMSEFENVTVADGDSVRPAKNKITMRHLFTMAAGLCYDLPPCLKSAAGKPMENVRCVKR